MAAVHKGFDVATMLVCVKTADGKVFWIGGKTRDCNFTFTRDPRDGLADWAQRGSIFDYLGPIQKPTVEIEAVLTDFAGEWREGVPDVPLALGAGTPALPEPSQPLLPSGGAGA